jgi:hypothetical protein
MTYKNKTKKIPKTQNQLKKNLSGLRYVFRCFQGIKTHNLNSPYHMKPSDTKINHFGGQNLPQIFSL